MNNAHLTASNVISDPSKYIPTTWGQKPQPFEVQTPSGQCALVRKLEIDDIIKMGVVNDLDYFSSALLDKGEGKKSKKKSGEDDGKSILDLVADPEKYDRLSATINKCMIAAVVMPQLSMPPESEESRVPERLYVDQIGFEDKMYIFGTIFEGLGDMSQFREGQGAGVGDVEKKQGDRDPSVADDGVL